MAADQSPLYFATRVAAEVRAQAEEIAQGRATAHAKHGTQSIEGQSSGDRLLAILTEEVGEVARAMNEYALGNTTHEEAGQAIRAELIDVMTVASAWVAKFDHEDAELFPARL